MTDDEGRCRFACRTNREAFIAGWLAMLDTVLILDKPDEGDVERAKTAYRKWRKEQRD